MSSSTPEPDSKARPAGGAPLHNANVAAVATNPSASSSSSPAELTAVVDSLLDALTRKFSTVSAEIFSKMDEMSARLDSLEEVIGVTGFESPAAASAAAAAVAAVAATTGSGDNRASNNSNNNNNNRSSGGSGGGGES